MKHLASLRGGKAGTRGFSVALLTFLSAFLFTSCRELEDISYSMVLSGQWEGDFGMYYDYVDARGRHYTFNSYDTRLTFTPAYPYASRGRGTQVDYYDFGPYEYQYYKFSWTVENGEIFLSYDYDHQLDTRISDYRMTNDYFSGIFMDTGTTFRLHKIADFYNWTPYVNVYGYADRPGWGLAYPSYAPSSRSDNLQLEDSIAAEGKVVSRGRRLTPLKQ